MTWTEESRWSCPFPGCNKTVTVYGSPEDVRCGLDACQVRHATEHRKAAVLSARLRKTNVDRPAPKWGAA